MDDDHFALKQRPFMQQDLIAGLTVAKTDLALRRRASQVLEPTLTPVEAHTDTGTSIESRPPRMEERERELLVRDGPPSIVRDVRDFFWPESAKSVEDAAWLIDRTWETYDCAGGQAEGGPLQNRVPKLEGVRRRRRADRTTPSASRCSANQDRTKA